MSTLELVFGWLLSASWQASVIALFVLLTQSLCSSRLNPRWRYALWLLVIVRLVLPAVPESDLSLFQFAPAPPAALTASVVEPLFVSPNPVAASVVPTEILEPRQSLSVFSLMAVTWLIGATILLGLTLMVNRRLARQVFVLPEISDPAIAKCFADAKAELTIRRPIRLVESSQVSSPAIMGIFRPTLLLPVDIRARFDATEMRFIFLHELAHYKRGDVVVQALISMLQVLHWFNPVLWYAFRRMRIDREPATDALVLSSAGEAEKELYGLMLIKLLDHFNQRRFHPTLVGILEEKDQFKRRFSLIARFTQGAYGWSFLGLILVGVLAAAFLTNGHARRVDREVYQFMTPEQILLRAVNIGDLATINKMLDAGVDVNVAGGPSDDFPLYAATNSNQLASVRLLLKRGANPNQKTSWGDPSVYRASWLGNKEIADALVEAGAIRNDLLYYAGTNDVKGLKRLDAKKPLTLEDVNAAINFAAASGSERAFAWLLPKVGPQDASQKASFAGNLYDMTSRGGHLEFLRRIEKIFPPTVEMDSLALENAVVWNRVEMAKYLLAKPGAHRSGDNPDQSFLFDVQSPEMAQFLISSGFDPNARDKFGTTALMRVSSSSWNPPETALVLLKHGADPSLRDNHGATALDYARDPATKAELVKYMRH